MALAVILHPIFVPIYLFFLLIEVEPVMSLVFGGANGLRFGLSLLVTVVAFPLASILYLKQKGMIDSLTMPSLKGRSLSYGITAFYYILSLVLLWDKQLPDVTYALFMGFIITLLLLMAISFEYKISAHLAAMGGAVAVLVWMGYYYGLWEMGYLMLAILLSGLLASSRLLLQAHKDHEVATGFLLGAVVMFATLVWMIP